MRKHYFFEKAEKKLTNELDVIRLVKSIRNLRLIT
jgi:hypothetical protein